MSTAVLQPSAVVFREDQYFAWWIYAALAFMLATTGLCYFWRAHGGQPPPHHIWSLQVPLYLLIGLGLPMTMIVGVLRMTTVVTPIICAVSFGWVPTMRWSVALGEVRGLEVVTYHPIRDSRGWGIRRGPDGERIFCARGNRGVRLHLADGSHILIGSQRPEELARAIDQARRGLAI